MAGPAGGTVSVYRGDRRLRVRFGWDPLQILRRLSNRDVHYLHRMGGETRAPTQVGTLDTVLKSTRGHHPVNPSGVGASQTGALIGAVAPAAYIDPDPAVDLVPLHIEVAEQHGQRGLAALTVIQKLLHRVPQCRLLPSIGVDMAIEVTNENRRTFINVPSRHLHSVPR